MKFLATVMFFFSTGFIAGTLQLMSDQPRPPASYTEPAVVFSSAGKRCIAWSGRYRGKLLYAVHCDDGTVIFTTNYLYL